MKKFFILSAVCFCACTSFAQTLFTYGNSSTDKEEFLRAYNKNKPATTDKAKALREYLELYTNFKLKVKAAQDLRLDTMAQIKYDVQNFRDQIADNYLTDENGLKNLINEAAARAQKDVQVLYFFVQQAENATPADTLKAYKAANELYNKLKNGSTNYTEIITDISTKIYPVKYSDVGYITAFTVPYDFENIIFGAPLNTITAPYKTKRGYNLFKVINQRTDVGKWKAAQLLFAYPPDADYTTKLAVKEKADSVYNLLKVGLAFDEAAKNFSEDRMTYLSGGELPEFTTGKYNNDFEKNVFALKNDKDITKPFETAFGYHIVKRIANTATLPVTDANYLFDIKQKVMQDERVNTVKEKFINDITVKTGYKKTGFIKEADLFSYADSAQKNGIVENVVAASIGKKPIIIFKDGSTVTLYNWLQYARNNAGDVENKLENRKELWKNFNKQEIINYYKNNLDNYNSEFKFQMQEFREGNMLFEIMERNVWSKAGIDTVGLKNYYEANKAKYVWQPSADVLVFNCADDKKAAEAIEGLSKGKSWLNIAENSNSQIQADSGRYELVQLPGFVEGMKPVANETSTIIKNADGTTAFVKYITLYPGGMIRNFNDARGLVINDYQNILEQKWVASLRKKYPVKTNEQLFETIIK